MDLSQHPACVDLSREIELLSFVVPCRVCRLWSSTVDYSGKGLIRIRVRTCRSSS